MGNIVYVDSCYLVLRTLLQNLKELWIEFCSTFTLLDVTSMISSFLA
jgi:hypothetical protein